MVKLVLSSCDFRNEESAKIIYDNLPKPIGLCRVLYFPNEKATDALIKSNKYLDRLCAFGFGKTNITIFNYFEPQVLDGVWFDAVYISGGNTFGTMKRLRESGADRLIKDYVNQGSVYIGGSAGAHIASADISHVEKYDIDTFGLDDLSGLRLFDGILICHYTDSRKADLGFLKANSPYPVTALSDSESLVVEY